MRLLVLFFAAALATAPGAWAQTAITLAAEPAPLIDAEINGRPVRLEVDLRFPAGLALSRASAERLRVRRVPLLVASVGIEGGGLVRARIARPRIVFAGEDARAFAVIMPTVVTSRADGVIGPGALPYDVVTIQLGPDQSGARDRVFALEDADEWTIRSQVGGHELRIAFDVTNQASVLNRSATRLFDGAGAIPAAGDLRLTPVIAGLSTLMQPVSTELRFEGLTLGPTLVRTNAPLLGADEPDAIVVEAESEGPRPSLTLGRGALDQAQCSSISVDRRTRRLTLRCIG